MLTEDQCSPHVLITLMPGIYRPTFEIQNYFAQQQLICFFPAITVTFEIRQADQHYHVPLLVSPFGYSTYRES